MALDTVSNLGSGAGVFAQVVGTDAQLRSLIAGSGINVALDTNEITVSVNQGASLSWAGQEKFLGGTTEAIPPVTPWSGDPTSYSAKVSRTAPAGGSVQPFAAFLVDCTTSPTSTSLEWTQLNNLENYAAQGENTSLYCKANRHSSGATWAGVFEARNVGGDLATSLYGLEIDLCSDGNDVNQNQQGIAIFYGAQTNTSGSGAATRQTNGLLMFPFVGGRNSLSNGVHIFGNVDQVFNSEANGLAAFVAHGIYTNAAIDLSTVGAGTAYLFHGKDNLSISLSTTAETAKIRYSSSTNEIQLQTGSTAKFSLPMDTSSTYLFDIQSGNAVDVSATSGGATAVSPAGYLRIRIDGNAYKLAFYLN